MKLPSTIPHPIPVVIRHEEDRHRVMLMAHSKPVHTIYVRPDDGATRMRVGHRIGTICYQFVPEGVLFGATWFRMDHEKEHWDKKKSRRLALHRLKHAPIYIFLPLDEPWKERYADAFTTFATSFAVKRGYATTEDYVCEHSMEQIEKAWTATLRHGFAKAAIRKAMYKGCWQKNTVT